MKNLDGIFSPSSIAVIGASTTPGKVGHDIFVNIMRGGYKGVLYPVNPATRSINSIRSYGSIGEIPESIDLAMIILPPKAALKAVDESIQKGAKGVVIVSAGFREVGPEGLAIENQVAGLCREAGVPLVGPNCLGVINPLPQISMNASFSARMPALGNISFVSQSGALCTSVLDFAAHRDFGFSKFISIGNKADVDETDVLEYLYHDPDTSVVMVYIEELRDGDRFVEVVRRMTAGERRMPVLVIKSGRTSAGAKAAASHTGAIAGTEAVYDAIFKQAGVIRVDTVNDLFDYANAFSFKQESPVGKVKRKLPAGNRVAIVTNAGGPGIIATDMTISSDLELAELSEETVSFLKEHLPSSANFHNPVDVIGDAGYVRYEKAIEGVLKDDNVDGVLVVLTPQSMTDAKGTAEAVVRSARGTNKPIVCSFMGVVDVSEGVRYLQQNGYPVYQFPENAAKSLGALNRYAAWLTREELPPFDLKHNKARAKEIIAKAVAAGESAIAGTEALEVLECYGFSVPKSGIAKSEDEAVSLAKMSGYPVVMKIVSPKILHKSDIGGVVLNVKDEAGVRESYKRIMANALKHASAEDIEGILVQKMVPQGEEVLLGINRYGIGTLLGFGLGGVLVELFKDVVFRLVPVSRTEVASMITEIKGYKLLTGFRGRPKADILAIEKALVSLSDLATDNPEILEMDINPLMVHPEGQGATVADCRIIFKAEGGH